MPPSPASHKMRPVSAFAKVGLFALILGAIGAVGAWLWLPDWLPPAAGVEAHRQDTLYLWLLVDERRSSSRSSSSFLGYSMWKFRARPGDMSDGAPIHGHTGLEIIWTVDPDRDRARLRGRGARSCSTATSRSSTGHMVVNVTGKPVRLVVHLSQARPPAHRHPGAAGRAARSSSACTRRRPT